MLMINDKKYFKIGRVVRPHGVHGAFIIHSYNPDPQHLIKGENLYFLKDEQKPVLTKITALKAKVANQGVIAKIAKISQREEAESLKGQEIVILRDSLEELGADEHYLADLIGFEVRTKDDKLIGLVENFLDAGAGLIFVIKNKVANQKEKEYLVPFVDDFILKIDSQNKKIIVNPVEGLLD